jgi:ferritin
VLHALEMPDNEYKSLLDVFQQVLEHEELVTSEINKLYEIALTEKDYTTGQFLQWYIEEQIEEESLVHSILDKINLTGGDKGGMFHIDKELDAMAAAESAAEEA